MKLPQFTIRSLLLATAIIALDIGLLKIFLLFDTQVGSFPDAMFKLVFGVIGIAAVAVLLRK